MCDIFLSIDVARLFHSLRFGRPPTVFFTGLVALITYKK